MAMAHTQVTRELVEEYQKDILKRHQFKHRRTGEVITEPKHAYCMSESDLNVYHSECTKARDERGLGVDANPEACPLLYAEDLERQAKRNLLDVTKPLHKIDYKILNIRQFNDLVEITLRFLAPFVSHENIMKKIEEKGKEK
jgi:hypothetical protein